jgi:hypothetical protein
MPAAPERSRALRRPAYENLQGRKPRFGHVGRAASGRTLSYGDLSAGRAALRGSDTRFELIVECDAPDQCSAVVAARNEMNRVCSTMAYRLSVTLKKNRSADTVWLRVGVSVPLVTKCS